MAHYVFSGAVFSAPGKLFIGDQFIGNVSKLEISPNQGVDDVAIKIKGKMQDPNPEYEQHLEEAKQAKQQEGEKLTNHPITALESKEMKQAVPGKGMQPVASDSKQEVLGASGMIPADKLHHVHVTGGRTVNLGNYESATFKVGVSVPCTKETLDDSYEFACQYISDRIDAAVEEMEAAKAA